MGFFSWFTIILTLLQRLAVLIFKTIHPSSAVDNTYHLLFSWQCTIQFKPDRGGDGFLCKVAHKTFESTILVFSLFFFSAVTPTVSLLKLQHTITKFVLLPFFFFFFLLCAQHNFSIHTLQPLLDP